MSNILNVSSQHGGQWTTSGGVSIGSIANIISNGTYSYGTYSYGSGSYHKDWYSIDVTKLNHQAARIWDCYHSDYEDYSFTTKFDINFKNLKHHFAYWALIYTDIEDVSLTKANGRSLIAFNSEQSYDCFNQWVADYKKRFYGSIITQIVPTNVPSNIELFDKCYVTIENKLVEKWIWIIQNLTHRCWFVDQNKLFFELEEEALLYKMTFA